jgi:hypothetical protein
VNVPSFRGSPKEGFVKKTYATPVVITNRVVRETMSSGSDNAEGAGLKFSVDAGSGFYL